MINKSKDYLKKKKPVLFSQMAAKEEADSEPDFEDESGYFFTGKTGGLQRDEALDTGDDRPPARGPGDPHRLQRWLLLRALIASLAIDCGVKVNILGADTRNVNGKAFGSMLLGLPEDHGEAVRAMNYLKAQKDVTVEEVPDYHG